MTLCYQTDSTWTISHSLLQSAPPSAVRLGPVAVFPGQNCFCPSFKCSILHSRSSHMHHADLILLSWVFPVHPLVRMAGMRDRRRASFQAMQNCPKRKIVHFMSDTSRPATAILYTSYSTTSTSPTHPSLYRSNHYPPVGVNHKYYQTSTIKQKLP